MSAAKHASGERLWTCDGCDKSSPWRGGWRALHGYESLNNVTESGAPTVMIVCSATCATLALSMNDAGENAA